MPIRSVDRIGIVSFRRTGEQRISSPRDLFLHADGYMQTDMAIHTIRTDTGALHSDRRGPYIRTDTGSVPTCGRDARVNLAPPQH